MRWHRVFADRSGGQELGGRVAGAQTQPPPKDLYGCYIVC